MRIKLIAPHENRKDTVLSGETFKLPRLCPPLLTALTPPEHDVRIVDESFAPDDQTRDVDLVGITVVTELSARAYQIAETYRKRGIKVVMGGIHPTVLPQEALSHADAVVVGEADEIWPQLLSDASSGRLQRLYRADKSADLQKMPRPNRALYPRPSGRGYTPFAYTIESSRGCPYDCEFCTIGTVAGKKYRTRPVADVIAEIESIDFPYLFFVDDSLALNRNHARELFKEMVPLKRLWVGQGTASLAGDMELLKLVRQSGCLGLLIGFETIQEYAQQEMRKITGLNFDYMEAMRRFHDEGIAVLGAFVFGFDHEDRDVFEQTLEFSMKAKIDGLQLRVLTPFPGTRLYSRLMEEGRLLAPEWWRRGLTSKSLLFKPKSITVDEFLSGMEYIERNVYSYTAIIKRFFGMSVWKRKLIGARLYAGFNLATRSRYLRNLKDMRPIDGLR